MKVIYDSPAVVPDGVKLNQIYEATTKGNNFIVNGIEFTKVKFEAMFKVIDDKNKKNEVNIIYQIDNKNVSEINKEPIKKTEEKNTKKDINN